MQGQTQRLLPSLLAAQMATSGLTSQMPMGQGLWTTGSHTGGCRENPGKNIKNAMNQVHIMGPFGLIFMQGGSHGVWEAYGMPPGPHGALWVHEAGRLAYLKGQILRNARDGALGRRF